MIRDLVQIRRLAEDRAAENERFRKYLKQHKFVERKFRHIADTIASDIDCTVCAQCCKEPEVNLLERDIDRLMKVLRITKRQFFAQYVDGEDEDGPILKRAESGCVFLGADNLCTVYDDRPSACQDFPHTVRGKGSLHFRFWRFLERAPYCPIVYNTLEAWKDEVKFPR
jgi:Fe-S-cluster containining protein